MTVKVFSCPQIAVRTLLPNIVDKTVNDIAKLIFDTLHIVHQ